MADKLLRGKQPLTMYKGSSGTNGGYLYRGGVIEPERVHPDDAERLVDEGFLEWVVRDGEQFRLVEDTDTGNAGDAVTVGDAGLVPEPERAKDIGTLNSDAPLKPETDIEVKRAAARAKLPADGSEPDGRAGKDVWIEFLAGKGYDYEELAKQDKAELQKLAKSA